MNYNKFYSVLLGILLLSSVATISIPSFEPQKATAQQGPPQFLETLPEKYRQSFTNQTAWTDEVYDVETQTGSLTFFPSPRIEVESGQWENYILDESDSNIIYRVHEGAIIFDKPSCSISAYSDPYILNENTKLIKSHSFSLQEAVNGTDIWSDITPNENCIPTMTNNGTHIIISGQYDQRQANNGIETGGIFKSEYVFNGHSVETFGIYENHDDLKDGTHKYKVTETIDADIEETKRKDQLYQNDFTLNHEELNDEDETFEFKIKDKKIRYDISKALKDQWSLKVQNDKKKIVSDFAKDKKALKKGEKVLVDPTLTLDSTGTYTDFMVEDANAGDTNACDTYSTGSDTSATGQVKSEVNTGSDCYFMGFHFEGLAAIAGNTVTEVKAKIETTACFTCDTTDFVRVTTDTNTQGATFFNECRDETGTVVKDNFSEWQTVSTNNEIILDDNTHMQTILDASEDDVTYCLRMNTLNANSNNEIRLATEEASGTPDGMELTITYSVGDTTYDIQATVFENNNSTAVGNSFVTIYNQSSTTTKKMDGSGTHGVTDLFWGEDKNVYHNVTVIGDGSAYPAYIINQSTIWLPPRTEYTPQTWIYRFDCSSNGAGDDGIFMFNGSYDSTTGSTGHFFNTTSFTTCDSNDVVKFSYKSNANGTLVHPDNPSYEGEIFVSLLDTDSWDDSFEKITADLVSLTTTSSGGNNITSSSYDAGTSLDTKTIEIYLRLANLEDPTVYARNNTDTFTAGSILQENSTSRTISLNSSGIAKFTGLNSMNNFTVIDSVYSYVVGEKINQNITTTSPIDIDVNVHELDFRSGTGDDAITYGPNATEAHHITSLSVPTVVNDHISYDATFTANGDSTIGIGGANLTTQLKIDVTNNSTLQYAPDYIRINGTDVGGTIASGIITSGTIQVGPPNKDIHLDIEIELDARTIIPQPPELANATMNQAGLKIQWSLPSSNGTGRTGFLIQNSSDGVTYADLVTGLGNTTTSHQDNSLAHLHLMFYKVCSEPYTTGYPCSEAYNKTAGFPNAPTISKYFNNTISQVDVLWNSGTQDSNSTRKDYRVRYDNTTSGDVAGWVTTVSNSTLASLSPSNAHNQTGVNANQTYVFQIAEGNSVGFSDWSTNQTIQTTAVPDAPAVTVASFNSTAFKYTWNMGSSNGGLPEKDYAIKYDINNGTAGWLSEVSNSTLASLSETNTYYHNGFSSGQQVTIQMWLGNLAGSSSWSSNSTGSLSGNTAGTLTINFTRGGDAIKIRPTIELTTGFPDPTLQTLKFYETSTLKETRTVNYLLSANSSQDFLADESFYDTKMSGTTKQNYKIVATITNTTGTVDVTSNWINTTSVYTADYFKSAQGDYTVNYTYTRDNTANELELTVNRHDTPFQIECAYLSGLFASPTWINETNKHWANQTASVDSGTTYVVSCYNDELLFQFSSYPNLNGTSVLTDFTGSLGDFFGVPVVFLFIILIAALFTGVNAPTGIIVLAVTIGTMGAMGFFVDDAGNNIITAEGWGIIVLLTILGLFFGKRFL